MKKLMTMLAAAAMAFGLFADDPAPTPTPINATGFESAGEFDVDGNLVTAETPWSCNDEAATLKKGEYIGGDKYVYPLDKPCYPAFNGDNNNYLSVKTAFAKPLVRAAATNVNDGAIFYDQVVKFTAFEEPAEITGNAKIAFYVQEVMDENDEPIATNLYVVAGKYVNNALSVATNNLGAIDIDAWHRLTIKAMKGYEKASVAFEVFLDGVALELNAPAMDAASAAGMEDTAKALNSAKKLFPSMAEGSLALAGLALAGTGAIDDVIATAAEPGTWAQDKYVTLGWDDHVTGFKYQIDEGTVETVSGKTAAGTISIVYSGNINVKLSDITYESENWGFDTVEKVGCSFDPETMTIGFTGENQAATIKAKDVTPRITMNGKNYANFAEVIKDITYPAELKINQTVEVGMDDNGKTDALFKGDVIIDLNGQTIKGIANGPKYVIDCKGNLTIVDNSQSKAGKIEIDTEKTTTYQGVVGVYALNTTDVKLTVSAGKFDGTVYLDPGDLEYGKATATISAGSFLVSANTVLGSDPAEFTLKDAVVPTSKLETVDDYFVVTPLTIWTVTFKKDAADAVAFATTNVVDGETLTLSLIPEPTKDNYTFAGWDYTEGTKITAHTTIVANWTANEYSITIANGGTTGASATPAKYTYDPVNSATITLAAGTKAGYEFDFWTVTAGEISENTLTIPAGTSGAITATANWTPITYTITVTGGTPGRDDYTAEDLVDADLEVTLTADTVSGKVFKNWTVTAPTEGFVLTDFDQEEALLTIKQGTLDNFVIVANFETAQTDPLPDIDPKDPDAKDQVTEKLTTAFGAESSAAQNITEVGQYKAFNSFLTEVGVKDISTDMSAAQKQYAYESFVLSSITANDQLFTAKPELKETAITISGTDAVVKIALTAGEQTIALAKDELAKYVKVGGAVDTIVDAATIKESFGTTEITLTVDMSKYPTAGFTKVVIPTPTQAN